MDNAVSKLVERVAKQFSISGRDRKKGTRVGTPRASYVADVFAQATSEDISGFDEHQLSSMVEKSWEQFSHTRGDSFSCLVSTLPAAGGSESAEPLTLVLVRSDDMPFLLSSVLAVLHRLDVDLHAIFHPVFTLQRHRQGKLTDYQGLVPPGLGLWRRESQVVAVLDPLASSAEREALASRLRAVLRDVELAVNDWSSMADRLEQVIVRFQSRPPAMPPEEISEAVEFLRWLRDDNFIFLGMREYRLQGDLKTGNLRSLQDTALGILKDPKMRILRRGKEFVNLSPEFREFLGQPLPLIITKASVRSRVHRPVHLDCVGIKAFSGDGALAGELRLVGLFTATAYTSSVRSIPFLRRKARLVVQRVGYDPKGHSGKALLNVLEGYPRDELFQIDNETLMSHAVSVLRLSNRPRVRVLPRGDKFGRFVSILVFVPRERYSTQKRAEIGKFLAESFDGRFSASYPDLRHDKLARIHYIIGRDEGKIPAPTRRRLEAGVNNIVRAWVDAFADTMKSNSALARHSRLLPIYRNAFSQSYQNSYAPEEAVEDVRVLETMRKSQPFAVRLYTVKADQNHIALKVFHSVDPIELSRRVPMLENIGFRVVSERTFRVQFRPDEFSGEMIWLHDMRLQPTDGDPIDLPRVKHRFEEAISAIWMGKSESDGYDALVLYAGMTWRQVAILRTYSRFLRQAGIPFSQDYMWSSLNRHHSIAQQILALFEARFDPELCVDSGVAKRRCSRLKTSLEKQLEAVTGLDEDRILRAFAEAVGATLRTNAYQFSPSGGPRPTIAIKLRSETLSFIPKPRPRFEVFTYSPRVEGVHLRFGKVARGGLRWSDRPQDFRTEILGLVKAQQVKNAVIVPVGAKGGFIPKMVPVRGSREAILEEAVAAYRLFINSLLDITDSMDSVGRMIKPANTVCHDGDDPYLVVAADKGTASFSDIANEEAVARGFWLGDAFASGGSAGYDHKRMGITARGAWEAVSRFFREMDRDIQSAPFTAVGVGDMSGDVFGNGMLLSKQTRLIAAFDHRDIFIDPNPDPDQSYGERKRLFATPRSSWQDYDSKRISRGGGVFSRSNKSIDLSPVAAASIGCEPGKSTPNDVIRAILRADVDLLWFGGIGTYVRASTENDYDVGDRATESVRVSASELRTRVIGEGANLGITQRGRVEFASRGGRVNTDAIDNSAGVNSSDLEVNVKVALSAPLAAGDLTLAERNRLLEDMTENVASLVLRNNRLQTLALSLTERRSHVTTHYLARLMRHLESNGALERSVEYLPTDAEIQDRLKAGQTLTRPEVAVLLAYAKIQLFDDIMGSDAITDPYFDNELLRYFPTALQENHPNAIADHRLRPDIIATVLSNSLVNRGGPAFAVRMSDETGADTGTITRAFVAARDCFRLTALNDRIDELDNQIPNAVQMAMYQRAQELAVSATAWLVRDGDFSGGLAPVVQHYQKGLDEVQPLLQSRQVAIGQVSDDAEVQAMITAGVDQSLIDALAMSSRAVIALDAVLTSATGSVSFARALNALLDVGSRYGLDQLMIQVSSMPIKDYYDRLVCQQSIDMLGLARRQIARHAIAAGGLDKLEQSHHNIFTSARNAILEAANAPTPTLSRFVLAANQLEKLAAVV